MSSYTDYLNIKSDVISKSIEFEKEVKLWFYEHDLILNDIQIEHRLTMNHFTINSVDKFNNHIIDFEKKFNVMCVRRIQNIIYDTSFKTSEWKFHFIGV